MELLYYWVEEEKTFKEHGFHLSNRFVFEVTIENENCKIKITENSSYIENFFGDHIVNLTAILGQNGAGKTNLLYDLIAKTTGYKYTHGTGYIQAYFDGSKIYISHTLTSNSDIANVEVETIHNYEVNPINEFQLGNRSSLITPSLPFDCGLIYFNPIYDFRDYPFDIDSREFEDVSSTYLMFKDFKNKNVGEYDMAAIHRFEEIKRQYRITNSSLLDEEVLSEIRMPSELDIEVQKTYLSTKERDLFGFSSSLYDVLSTYGSKVWDSHYIESENALDDSEKESLANKEKAKTWLITNYLDHYFYCLAQNKDYQDERVNVKVEDLSFFQRNKITDYSKTDTWPKMTYHEYRDLLIEFFDKQQFLNYSISENVLSLYEIIDEYASVEVENDAVFILPYEHSFEFINLCDEFCQSFNNPYVTSIIRVQWRNLSSGELGFLNLFARIFQAYSNYNSLLDDTDTNPKKIFYLFIDEGEHGMHPRWQKKYIKLLIEFLRNFHGAKFQILVTSHSPIMLSDIPKSNTIFLNKTGELTNVIKNEDMNMTFGANIHTLFKDSFFMNDGLIGDFAVMKIKELHDEIKESSEVGVEDYNRLMKQIELIGEPVIKNSLKAEITKKQNNDALIKFHEDELNRLKSKRDSND